MLFSTINILVIEDNPGDFVLIEVYLQATRISTGYIAHASTLQEGIECLQQKSIDLVLLDLSLPDSFGMHSYARIKEANSNVPVIVLSGSHDEALALDIVKEGAQDYLLKDDLGARILEKTILYAIERKKNIAALQLSQTQYQFLFDNNPIPMWTYELDTFRFTMVNDAATIHYGYSREEFLSMTIMEIRPPEEKERALKYTQIPQSFAFRNAGVWTHKKKSGDIIIVEIASHIVEHTNKRTKLVVAYDITERVKARAGLEKSERIFRSVAESFPNGSVNLLDADYNILYSNGQEYKKLNIDPCQIIGQNFLAQQSKERFFEISTKLANSLKGQTVTFETKQKSNYYNVIAAPISPGEDSREKIILITQNITEKKRTEQHLKLLESVVINSANGVMIIDNPSNGSTPMQIIFANKAQQDMTGYGLHELLGSNPKIFQGKDTDPVTVQKIRTAITRYVPVEVTMVNYKKDSTPYWVQLSIVPVFNNKHVCTHFVGLSKDITEQKVAEQEIKKANERYEMLSRATNEAMWDWNMYHDRIIWSKAIHAVFGYDESQTANSNFNWWKKRIHPDDRKRVIKKITDTIKNRDSIRVDEYLFLCRSGEYKMVYDRSYLMYDDASNKAIRMIGSLQDITELRNKELQLLDQNRRLYEIAEINSHVIRKPVANILGLVDTLNLLHINNAEANEILEKLEVCTRELDEVIYAIAQKTL